jgi:hypothetical protein
VKGIAVFVALLLVGLGVASYLLTRPADRTLSPSDGAWVTRYEAWTRRTERLVDHAYTGMGDSAAQNSRLLAPLMTCPASFAALGQSPDLLKRVRGAAQAACGETQVSIEVNDQFALASLATTKQHLYQAEDWLRQGRSRLREQLAPNE